MATRIIGPKSTSKLDSIRKQRDAFFAGCQFYEALQLYKTMISRANSRRDHEAAVEMALDGATQLLKHKQGNAGGELACSLIDAYQKLEAEPTLERIQTILELFWIFPSNSRSSQSTFIKNAIRWSVSCKPIPDVEESKPDASSSPSIPQSSTNSSTPSSAKQPRPDYKNISVSTLQGHPDLHLAFARFHLIDIETMQRTDADDMDTSSSDQNSSKETRNKVDIDYAGAHAHYIRAAGANQKLALEYGNSVRTKLMACVAHLYSQKENASSVTAGLNEGEYDTYSEHVALLHCWMSRGYDSEEDLFLTRTVLQYCAVEDLRGANAILDAYMNSLPSNRQQAVAQTPLLHFCQFLLKTLERNAAPLFDLLLHKYAAVLTRDPSFQSYLDKIANLFFDRPMPKGMLENLFS